MNPIEKLSALYRLVLAYGQSTLDVQKYRLIKLGSDSIGRILSIGLLIFVLAITLGLLNIGTALWLGEYYGSLFIGFFILAAVYFALCIIYLLFFRKLFSARMANYVIKKILEK
jgi:uncharacterized membrane protein YedE/YeeE